MKPQIGQNNQLKQFLAELSKINHKLAKRNLHGFLTPFA
jgi:hypothetical protein